MTDTKSRFKIENTDFGFRSFLQSSYSENNKKFQSIGKLIGDKLPVPALSWRSLFLSYVKRLVQLFRRLKWNVSRSIFMGRGIYFKYISNLSILIIVVFGTFVYLQYYSVQGKQPVLASRYAKGALEEEAALNAPAGAAVLTEVKLPIVKYPVSSGDTLSSISKKFSTPENQISVDSIKWANNLKSDDLQPGTLLDIPPVSGTLHVVAQGETALDILKKYGKINDKSSDIEVFAALQQLTNDNYLDVKVEGDRKVPVLPEAGRRLIVAGGVIPQDPSTKAVAQAPRQTSSLPQQVFSQSNSSTGFIWPVVGGIGTITQYFTSARYGYGHTGVDIADFSGPQLVAVANGTVLSTGWENGGGGCVVRVKLDDFGPYKNLSALYAHSRCNYLVTPGQRITQGQALVNMGSTGRSTGTHVHFEMFQNGYFVNPLNYIRR